MSDNNSQGIRNLNEKERLVVLALNVLLALGVFFISTGELVPSGTGASIWLLAATSYWFLVLLGTPFFTPPKDSLTTAVVVILLLLPLEFADTLNFGTSLTILKWTGITWALVVGSLAIAAIVRRETVEGKIFFHLSKFLGRGELLFTPVIIITALAFYQDTISWMYWLLAFWTIMLTVKPVEVAYRAYLYLVESFRKDLSEEAERMGTINRIDDPNIVRVTLREKADWSPNKIHAVHMPDGTSKPLLPLFRQVQNEEVIGTGLLCDSKIKVPNSVTGGVYEIVSQDNGYLETLTASLSGDNGATKVAGIVVENSSIKKMSFQAVRGIPLTEGMVVFAFMGGKKIYYQILDANTAEESFQTNPYGMHIVTATQLGSFDEDKGFQKFTWLPDMNQPVFLVEKTDVLENKVDEWDFCIGKIPKTGFEIMANLKDLIGYHAAILGITGTGKTELALDIIKNALKKEVKVFCVDFTGEYRPRLKDEDVQSVGLSAAKIQELEKALHAVSVGTYGAKEERAALDKFLKTIVPEVEKDIDDFLMDESKNLAIFELSEIKNTRATLRITEMYTSAIMDWARKNRKARTILIVLEEAHTLIPEVYSAGFDADTQWIVGQIGQIALQGRKYGVGLLLMSQRTALVSKTILSQCNTYFTHSLVDKTSLDYLGGVYSPEHVKAIPNLRSREFITTGKAIKSEQSLLVRTPFDQSKLDASKALDTTYEEVRKGRDQAIEALIEEL